MPIKLQRLKNGKVRLVNEDGKQIYGSAKYDGNLYWYGRDNTETYMRPAKYYPTQATIDNIKENEGWHQGWQTRAGDPNPTTGWGFKQTPELKKRFPNGMTREQADKYLIEEAIPQRIVLFEQATPRFNTYNQNQLDALFDLYYNVGHGGYTSKSPKLQQALQARDIQGILDNIDHGYNDPENPGLKDRRDWERDLFKTPMQRPKKRFGGTIKKRF